MDLDEILCVDRCRDMDELITFEPDPDCFLRYRISAAFHPCNTLLIIAGASPGETKCGLRYVKYDIAVMWHIPPPNSSPSFKVSTIFTLMTIVDISPMVNQNQYAV